MSHTTIIITRLALLTIGGFGSAVCAYAEEGAAAVAALTRPSSEIEIGIGNVSRDSYKFGEYNGLQDDGPFTIGNVDIEKRSPYDSEGTNYLRFQANNLGLDTRSARLDLARQGRFKISLGYDALRRNLSDSYQTPFNGIGTNSLSLPGNWLMPIVPQVSTVNLNYRVLLPQTGDAATLAAAPNAAQLATLQRIRAADLPAFHNVNVRTLRHRSEALVAYNFNSRWAVSANFRQENKDGLKPVGAVSAFGAGGDSVVILPERIDTTTAQYNLALHFTGAKLFVEAGYYGSIFDNHVRSMTWQEPKNLAVAPSYATAPSNQFHQLALSGRYDLANATKLMLNASYGRSTQNEAFLTPSAFNPDAFVAPASSANARVITKSLNLNLRTRLSPVWNLAADLKYSDRDNRTPVRQYLFYDIDAESNFATAPSPFNAFLRRTDVGQNANIYNNRPQSRSVTQARITSDYSLGHSQTIAAGYEWERNRRSCNGTWISCSDAAATTDNSFQAQWRSALSDTLNAQLAYTRAARRVDYNSNAWLAEVPLANVVGSGATISVYDYLTQNGLTGFGPLRGFPNPALTGNAAILTPNNNIVLQRFYGSRNNVSEIPGMRRFNAADRNRDKLRAMADWQVLEKLALQLAADFNRDEYVNSQYGLQRAKDSAVNLDVSYAVSTRLSANAFLSYEEQNSGMTSFPSNISNTNPATVVANNVLAGSPCYTSVQPHNGDAKIDPCNQWSAATHEKALTLGLTLADKGLRAGKLDLSLDLLYTRGRSAIDVLGGTYVNNPRSASVGQPGVLFIAAENLPRVTTDLFAIGANGEYQINKSSALRLTYRYQRLKSSSDFAYAGLQFGSVAGFMPTNEQVPVYSVHVLGVSYVNRFH